MDTMVPRLAVRVMIVTSPLKDIMISLEFLRQTRLHTRQQHKVKQNTPVLASILQTLSTNYK